MDRLLDLAGGDARRTTSTHQAGGHGQLTALDTIDEMDAESLLSMALEDLGPAGDPESGDQR
jgi:hypothetical protein